MENGVLCEMLFILIEGDSASCTNMNEMEDTVLSDNRDTEWCFEILLLCGI